MALHTITVRPKLCPHTVVYTHYRCFQLFESPASSATGQVIRYTHLKWHTHVHKQKSDLLTMSSATRHTKSRWYQRSVSVWAVAIPLVVTTMKDKKKKGFFFFLTIHPLLEKSAVQIQRDGVTGVNGKTVGMELQETWNWKIHNNVTTLSLWRWGIDNWLILLYSVGTNQKSTDRRVS